MPARASSSGDGVTLLSSSGTGRDGDGRGGRRPATPKDACGTAAAAWNGDTAGTGLSPCAWQRMS